MPHLYGADLLLPDFSRVDGARYAVVACDQYTSEPEVWHETERIVGDAPSALRMILPEVWLGERTARTPKIHAAMREYRKSVLVSHPDTLIYLRRECGDGGAVREGLICAIDLEDYDYRSGTRSPIRPTEGTVTDRIPPRLDVRRGAPLELPHVMLLFDNPTSPIFPICEQATRGTAPLYDIQLMQGGGRAVGYAVPAAARERLFAAIEAHEDAARDRCPDAPLLYAVGDGNHSLATAKAYYEELKSLLGEAAAQHPARYALIELCSLSSPAIQFRPIYRAVFGTDPKELLGALRADADAPHDEKYPCQSITALLPDGSETKVTYAHGSHPLTVGSLQLFLDEYAKTHPDAVIDYIHGEDSLASIVREQGAVGFLFDGMEKDELFPAVSASGVLPRKTFSMGEAYDKRYYLEAREICCHGEEEKA